METGTCSRQTLQLQIHIRNISHRNLSLLILMLDNQRRYHTLRRRLMYESFWSFMICVSADETDDGLNSKTEEGQWRQLARTLDWKNRPQRFGREDEGT